MYNESERKMNGIKTKHVIKFQFLRQILVDPKATVMKSVKLGLEFVNVSWWS